MATDSHCDTWKTERCFLGGGSESGGFRPQTKMDLATGKSLKVGKTVARAALLACLGSLALAGSALASAEDQYVELAPSPGNERPTRGLGNGTADPARFDLTGPDAAAIARIAALFAAGQDRGEGTDSSSGGDGDAGVAASIFGGGPGGGMGLLLPLALLITLGAGLGAFLLRRSGESKR